MSFSTLPPEICGSICHELKELGGNLTPLCTTSHNFSREAERILYHSVDLRGCELPAIKSLEILDIAKIAKALRKCINLKELRGHHEWMLSGFPFCLQKFENQDPHIECVTGETPATLTTLSVRGAWAYGPSSISDTLTSIAASVPALLYLRIIELQKLPVYSGHNARPLTPILRKGFRKLQTFVLHVRNILCFLSPPDLGSPNSHSDNYDMASAPDLEHLGVDILKACPTLLRAAIGSGVVRGQEMRCVLMRANGGGGNSGRGSDGLGVRGAQYVLEPVKQWICSSPPPAATHNTVSNNDGAVLYSQYIYQLDRDVVYGYGTLHSYRVQDQTLRFDLRTGWSQHCLLSPGLVQTLESRPLRLLAANSLAGGRLAIKRVAQSGQTTTQSPIKKETPFI
ncbi:hypothetical protein B0H14DRAFT_2575255 [Mycena olivaceomarginata]|nr:hypothetical protein B0H14DRAFT_2575255 [Mycena olivaceomarginata]